MFTHVVFFKLKDRSEENRAAVRDLILSMRGKIPSLVDLEAGADVLQTERSYDVVLLSRFESKQGFEQYRVHPFHQKVAAQLLEKSEGAAAVDYED